MTDGHEHITSLGYRLERLTNPNVEALLRACRVDALDEPPPPWTTSEFLLAQTLAGGTAACVGWNRRGPIAVIHSLAVAPTSRGSGIGAGLLASAMGAIMDEDPVEAMVLSTDSNAARRLFTSAGFSGADLDELPADVLEHPTFAAGRAYTMTRRYSGTKPGLDNCAFRVIVNNTEDATLPLGSVFFFRQNGEIVESSYRGGPVRRGHLIGLINGDEFDFRWHQYVEDGRLQAGDGRIFVEALPDGRRELRGPLSHVESNELLLREV